MEGRVGSSASVSTKVGAALTWKRVKALGSITHDTRRVSISSPTAAMVWRIDWALSPRSTRVAPERVAWSTRRCRLARGMSSVMKMRSALVPLVRGRRRGERRALPGHGGDVDRARCCRLVGARPDVRHAAQGVIGQALGRWKRLGLEGPRHVVRTRPLRWLGWVIAVRRLW